MNSTESIQRRSNHMSRLMKWPLVCGLCCLALTSASMAADALYQNDAVVSYPGTASYPPVIDATNFVNNNSFSINFTTFSLNTEFYETSDTVNYTNIGSMVVNTGFKFDNRSSSTGERSMSGNFYNPGTVSCGSLTDSSVFFFGGGFFFFGAGQFTAWATNIVNSGTVNVGTDGFIQFTGENVDLTRSSLTVEGNSANTAGSGVFGLNTNFWDPSFDLSANTAFSAFIPIAPFFLDLTNSTAFFDVATPAPGNNIIRAVFIQDNSGPNVTYNVYFGTAGLGIGNGNVTIEWIGSALDAASGNSFSNYLYLNDNYVRGVATNLFLINGVPDNYTFTASSTPLDLGVAPTAAGFLNVFVPGTITNRYSFANIDLTSTTVSTNDIPNHSVTNLPGRIQISASKDLTLSLAEITGMNYFSLQATNQFNGSDGALIAAPYSDINIGVTNGFLMVTNLLKAEIPNWGGNIQAWNTRWLEVDTVNGVTNDFRVVIVGSQLSPTTMAQVQDLILHGTNSIVISDTFNVMRTLSADAQNLTLTTNGPGVGATSLDGELNLGTSSISWQSSVPNLRNLTNNGAIRTLNQANFGGPLVINANPSAPAIAATGMLSKASSTVTNIAINERVTIGTNRYAFVSKLTNSIANQIKVAGTFDGSMSNLIAAINHGAGAGTNYSTNTHANPFVTAGKLTNHAFTVVAIVAGASGNTNSTLLSSTNNLTWNGHVTLSGGVDFVAGSTNVVTFPYDNFINNGLVSDQASVIYANNFLSSGVFSNGIGSFTLQSLTAITTNGSVNAGGDISIAASSLVTSNLVMQAGRSLTLRLTNLLTDTGVGSSNNWFVGGGSSVGLSLPIKPLIGDLLGTTITCVANTNKNVVNTWAGVDRGRSTSGYTNNAAIGRLILDATPSLIAGHSGIFTFKGASVSNAIYVDYLELRDQATNFNNGTVPSLSINTNLVIYYAQAMANGVSVAKKLNGLNSNHLLWVSNYIGQFSFTNIVYPDGTTNTFNAAVASDNVFDSDGDGIANANDPTPFFVSSQVNFALAVSNVPPLKVKLTWNSIPSSTNYVFFTTNLALPNWRPVLTNISPSAVPPAGGWPITNTAYHFPNAVLPGFYRVRVDPAN